MNKNNQCEIVRDLLPLYNDDTLSRASREFVENHLENCPECKDVLAKIKKEIKPPTLPDFERASRSSFKKFKNKLKKKNLIIAGSTALVVVGLICAVFAVLYHQTPIEYREGLLDVELHNVQYLKDDEGRIVILTENKPKPGSTTVTTENEIEITVTGDSSGDNSSGGVLNNPESPQIAENSGLTKEFTGQAIDVKFNGNWYCSYCASREIEKDGETVRVVYVYYAKTPLTDDKATTPTQGGTFFRIGEPTGFKGKTEVYYVVFDNDNYEQLTDEQFYDMRNSGTLIWEGQVE
jgi:hypothetical protein